MDLSPQRFDRLVDLTYAALDDKGTWHALLECLNEALGTRAVHLWAFDVRHGSLSYSDGANIAPDVDLRYVQEYQFIDPRLALIRAAPVGQWISCHEHFDDAFIAASPFYQDFLLPFGVRYVSACKLLDNETATVMLACGSEAGNGPLGEEALAFVRRLSPHLSRACRIGLAHFVYSAQALVGRALADKLSQPVLLLSTAGDLVLANEAATRLLGATSLLGIADGRLVLPERYRKEFHDHCAHLESDLRAGKNCCEPGFCSLRIASEPDAAPEVLYGFFTVLLPERVMGTFGRRPLVMMYLYHPDAAQALNPGLLSAAFGLSQAECRLAALLAEGMQLKSIAEALGVQYDTVRKQLMSIYQKTSTNRQPDLVRLLLHLPAAPVN